MNTFLSFDVIRIAVLSLVVGCVGGSLSAVEIIAHRGASYDAPENTLASMRLGWKQKADAVELDIHLSKDGKIITTHDYDSKRIGGVDRKIVDQTWDELQQIDVGAWKHSQYAGEKIPTIESILKTIPDGKRAFIEIKVGSEILPELERAMKASGKKPEQLSIIAFKFEVCRDAKARFPKHEVYWLQSYKKDKVSGQFPKIDDLIQKAKEAHLDGLDLNHEFPIDKAFVKKVHDAGLKLYTWTVNDADVARKEVEAGVDGITTDRPLWLRQQLENR